MRGEGGGDQILKLQLAQICFQCDAILPQKGVKGVAHQQTIL